MEGGVEAGAHLAHVRAGMIDDIWMSIVVGDRCWRKSDRIEFCFFLPIRRLTVQRFSTPRCFSRATASRSPGDSNSPKADWFLQGSMPYQMHAKDCARLFTSKYTTLLQIPREDDPKSLLRALREAGLDSR